MPAYSALIGKWAENTLGTSMEKFLKEWPQWKDDDKVSYAFKIVKIHRNAFSHAYIPIVGDRFLFVPNQQTRKLIKETRFSIDELKTERSDLPFALLLPCLHEPFLIDFYEKDQVG